ncbi:MAG: sensor histidine kinase [Planctomycetota bacterium]
MSEPGRSALELLGALAGGLVHEIKNPLSTLTINLTLLKEDLEAALPQDRAVLRRVELLQKEVRRLESVLDDFVRYAGMRRLEKRRHDLKELAGEMLEFVGPGFKRDGVRIEADVSPAPVDVDAALYKQALLNILLNAQQAMEGGGLVRVTGGPSGGQVVLEIADTGRGIAPEHLDKVFQVYYSASKAGSGLGLPTARRILEEHGGSVELESELGKGTRVRLLLPAARDA